MKKFSWFSSRFLLYFVKLLCLLFLFQTVQAAPSSQISWNQIDQLIKNQKFTTARKQIDALLQQSRLKKDLETWRQALLLATSMRYQNSQYEVAVNFLTQQPWPQDKDSQLILNLHVAELLSSYVNRYRWEIQKREKIISKKKLPLKKKSLNQLLADINQAYFQAYQLSKNRNEPIASLGHLSLPSLKNIFVKTDYPKNIRGGVFDTVTYLWVDFLANSSLWSPSHSNQSAGLSIKQLLAYPQGVRVEDSKIHPLKRIVRLLTDLENYQKNHKKPEAGIEAFRVKLKQLVNYKNMQTQFSLNKNDRKLLTHSLRTKLNQPVVAVLPWSNRLRADLAVLIKESATPDANIQALAVLNQCVARFKKHRATQFCTYQKDQILSPSLSLSSMKTDGLGKRSLQLSHKNTRKVYFKAWRIPLVEAIKADKYDKIRQLLGSNPKIRRKADVSWQSTLPPTKDYKAHITYFTPPIRQMGYWMIAVSTQPDFKLQDKQNPIASSGLNLSRLLIDARSTDREFNLTVYQGESGQLAGKVQVELWKAGYNQAQLIATKQTTGDGRVSFPVKGEAYKVVAKYGNDFVILDNMSPSYSPRENPFTKSSLIFTDRAIYRPGQKIKWKVVAYAGNKATGKFKVLANNAGWVKLLDANGKQVEVIKLTTNQYGSASGEFTAKAGLTLGRWQLQSSWADKNRTVQQSIKVEEYKRPTFTTEIEQSKNQLRLNQPVKLSGLARYYFGQPVASGKVKWRVERSVNEIRPYWGYYRGGRSFRGNETIKTGIAKLDAKGKFTLSFTPKAAANPDNKQLNYRFKITADVTDSGGETHTATRTFNIGSTSIQANFKLDNAYLSTGKAYQFDVYRHDLNDMPRAGLAHWSLSRVQQPARPLMPADLPVSLDRNNIKINTKNKQNAFQTKGDKLSPRWNHMPDLQIYSKGWKDVGMVVQGTLRHDDSGNAIIKLKALPAGIYRLNYNTKDKWGKPFNLKRMLIVGGKSPAPIKIPLLLKAQSSSVEVGDNIKLLAGSGFTQTPVILEVYQGSKLLKRSLQRGGIKQFEYPVTAKNRGSLTFVLTIIKDYQLIQKIQEVSVPWTDKNLKVAFSTFRDKLRPSQKETWRVTVKDVNDKPLGKGAVELLASMFDKSLEFFDKHNPPSVSTLYRTQNPYYIRQASSMGQAYGLYQQGYSSGVAYPKTYQSVRLFLMGSGQMLESKGGMMMAEAMPAPVMASPAPRRMMARRAPANVNALQKKAKAGGNCHEHPASHKTKSIKHCHPNPQASHGYAGGADKGAGVAGRTNDLASVTVRKNFNETAFFYPHLVLENNGSVAFEFEVPESLTEWKVWVSAITKDLRGGSVTQFANTSKELMVRPYLPRFLRSGDQAYIEVLINNSGKKTLAGKLEFDVINPETKQTIAHNFKLVNGQRNFKVAGGQSTRLRYSLSAPSDLGIVAIRARASASNGAETFTDGEQRPLPILPSRIHLSQSRFVALQGNSTRKMSFSELAQNKDASRVNDSLVVTVDGQLFYSTLKALPYLTDYPYECTEQTMNRFLSTSIISSVFNKHPAIASMAKKMAGQRKSQYENWEAVDKDPNRKMLLEETPWLRQAQGGSTDMDTLIRVLDPKVARKQYQSALNKLIKAQAASGGFPWWDGGRPSAYMTVYLLHGFSRALEFKVDMPKARIQRAWKFLHKHYNGKLKKDLNNSNNLHLITLINYVLSAYPDNSWSGGVFSAQERKLMLDKSFKSWRKLPPLLKAYLSLTLKRAGRSHQATLVFDSIMDSAKTDKDLGTYFAPEDRSWLWYNDRVDTHAFILRTLMELNPSDSRRHGLVQWLMLNKKLNHWKSTRATAESIYALIYYLKQDGQLSQNERATIKVGNSLSKALLFKADEYTGARNQLVIKANKIKPDMANISVSNQAKSLMFASATWHFSTEKLPKSTQGDFFNVSRRFYKRVQKGNQKVLQPLAEGAVVAVGDELEVQLSLRVKHSAEFVHLRAPRGAGFEPMSHTSGYQWQTGIGYYEEIRDSGANYFFERLPAGEYSFKYRLRATTAGQFRVAPATVQSIYAPEFNAYSSGKRLGIK